MKLNKEDHSFLMKSDYVIYPMNKKMESRFYGTKIVWDEYILKRNSKYYLAYHCAEPLEIQETTLSIQQGDVDREYILRVYGIDIEKVSPIILSR